MTSTVKVGSCRLHHHMVAQTMWHCVCHSSLVDVKVEQVACPGIRSTPYLDTPGIWFSCDKLQDLVTCILKKIKATEKKNVNILRKINSLVNKLEPCLKMHAHTQISPCLKHTYNLTPFHKNSKQAHELDMHAQVYFFHFSLFHVPILSLLSFFFDKYE